MKTAPATLRATATIQEVGSHASERASEKPSAAPASENAAETTPTPAATARSRFRVTPALAESLPAREVDLGIHEVAVAFDVAALAADDEDDRVLVARVRDAPRLGRGDVEQPALAELA